MPVNYCLSPYTPLKTRGRKKESQEILFACLPEHSDFFSRVQQQWGKDDTVYGIKWDARQRIFAELYFYKTPWTKNNAMGNLLPQIDHLYENPQTFMVSYDVGENTAHAYTAFEKGRKGGRTKENTYLFYHGRREKVLFTSLYPHPYLDFLTPCESLCYALKKHTSGYYASGITLQQALQFLSVVRAPHVLETYMKKYGRYLEHMLYDVGFDANAQKFSFYGYF